MLQAATMFLATLALALMISLLRARYSDVTDHVRPTLTMTDLEALAAYKVASTAHRISTGHSDSISIIREMMTLEQIENLFSQRCGDHWTSIRTNSISVRTAE